MPGPSPVQTSSLSPGYLKTTALHLGRETPFTKPQSYNPLTDDRVNVIRQAPPGTGTTTLSNFRSGQIFPVANPTCGNGSDLRLKSPIFQVGPNDNDPCTLRSNRTDGLSTDPCRRRPNSPSVCRHCTSDIAQPKTECKRPFFNTF